MLSFGSGGSVKNYCFNYFNFIWDSNSIISVFHFLPPIPPVCPSLPSLACVLLLSRSAHVQIVMLVRLYGRSLWHYQQTQSHIELPGPLALIIFPPPLPQCPPSLRFRGSFVDALDAHFPRHADFPLVSKRTGVASSWMPALPSHHCLDVPAGKSITIPLYHFFFIICWSESTKEQLPFTSSSVSLGYSFYRKDIQSLCLIAPVFRLMSCFCSSLLRWWRLFEWLFVC